MIGQSGRWSSLQRAIRSVSAPRIETDKLPLVAFKVGMFARMALFYYVLLPSLPGEQEWQAASETEDERQYQPDFRSAFGLSLIHISEPTRRS